MLAYCTQDSKWSQSFYMANKSVFVFLSNWLKLINIFCFRCWFSILKANNGANGPLLHEYYGLLFKNHRISVWLQTDNLTRITGKIKINFPWMSISDLHFWMASCHWRLDSIQASNLKQIEHKGSITCLFYRQPHESSLVSSNTVKDVSSKWTTDNFICSFKHCSSPVSCKKLFVSEIQIHHSFASRSLSTSNVDTRTNAGSVEYPQGLFAR